MTSRNPIPTPGLPVPPVPADYDRNAVVTIQGGGVYGFNLLGQLQAVLDSGIQPVALAGTSAGAVVATLHWADWQPNDIRDRFMELVGEPDGLTNLVGPFPPPGRGFDFDGFLRWSLRLESYFAWAGRGLRRAGEGRLRSLLLRHFCLLPAYALAAPFSVGTVLRAVADLRALGGGVQARGVFTGRAFEDLIDTLLRDSPRLRGIDQAAPRTRADGQRRLLTFAEVRDWVASQGLPPPPPLILTATNLRSRRLELFDSLDPACDHMFVARAARASAGFPFFFQPVDYRHADRDDSYVDGGVICNFPAFVFAESFRQRLLGHVDYNAVATRPWVHIGLRLTDSDRPHVTQELYTPGAYLKAMWAMATGAARTDLENRVAGMLSRTVSVEMPFADTNGPAGVMDIEKIDAGTISSMFRRGQDSARRCLGSLEFRLPDTEEVEEELKKLIAQADALSCNFGPPGPIFRANVYVPEGPYLVPHYRVNMGDPNLDTDRDLTLRFDAGLTGFCFTRRRPVLCNLDWFEALRNASPTLADAVELFGLSEEQQDSVRKDRTWLLSVPIIDPYASFPMELSPNPEVGTGGPHFTELASPVDGAVFGVLNLDADFDYDTPGGVPSDPDEQVKDSRVLALVSIMVASSLTLGTLLASRFARCPPTC